VVVVWRLATAAWEQARWSSPPVPWGAADCIAAAAAAATLMRRGSVQWAELSLSPFEEPTEGE